jgi:hypothetical protein
LFKEEEFDEAEPAGVDPADVGPVDEEPAGAGESAGVVGTLWASNIDPLRTTTNQNCLFMNRPAEYNRLVIGCRIAIPGFPYSTLAEASIAEKAEICSKPRSTGALRIPVPKGRVTIAQRFQRVRENSFSGNSVE